MRDRMEKQVKLAGHEVPCEGHGTGDMGQGRGAGAGLTVMARVARHLLVPSIASTRATFLSDSFTKSPLQSQVTWGEVHLWKIVS